MTSLRTAVLCAASLVAACATADQGATPIPGTDARVDGQTGVIDAPVADDALTIIDAPSIDAAVNTFTLSQNTSTLSVPLGSLACRNNADGTTGDNSWYRVFRLADEGVTGGARITAVSFGVQEAAGMPTVQVKVGTYSGSVSPPPTMLDTALITPIASELYTVPVINTNATQLVTVPITANVPALAQVIVEIYVADLAGTGKYFYLGGNASGQEAPAYLRSDKCGFTQPRTPASISSTHENKHLVITATGTL